METSFLDVTRCRYVETLTEDIIPFWLRHGVDHEYGGYLTGLDRSGTIIETDKAIWFQGRFAWVLATMAQRFPTHPDRPRWLEAAWSGIEFLRVHGVDESGRMRYRVTRDGQPLVTRRYVFSDCFAAIAEAAWAGATGDVESLKRATGHLNTARRFSQDPDELPPKMNAHTRPSVGLALPMILINVAQEIRINAAAVGAVSDTAERTIDEAYRTIRDVLYQPEHRCFMEQTNPDGTIQDHFEGRIINPGHSLEAVWFLLREADERGDVLGTGRGDGVTSAVERGAEMQATALAVLDRMLEIGWDREYGGIYYFRDLYDRPVAEYWHDMKFWWPHAEAIIATLFAFTRTREERYLSWFRKIDQWTHVHFPDRMFGEWFGYLHRDGSLSSSLKGNMFKGPFHVPRMYMEGARLLERLAKE